jgi:hypothetical protein
MEGPRRVVSLGADGGRQAEQGDDEDETDDLGEDDDRRSAMSRKRTTSVASTGIPRSPACSLVETQRQKAAVEAHRRDRHDGDAQGRRERAGRLRVT